MQICSIDKCDKKVKCRGWCRLHYERWKRNGNPEKSLITIGCSITGCSKKHQARGLCVMHYERFRQHGNPQIVKKNCKPLFSTFDETFLNYFERGNNEECWEWKGTIIKAGYGRVHFKCKYMSAHRYSYQYFIGKIENDLWVLHKCDNRKCVNPSHLFLGDVYDNNADCVNKGRHRTFPNAIKIKGDAHAMAKLKANDIVQIRYMINNGFKDSDISNLFNVSRSAINHVKIGRTWKHI